MKAFRVLVAEFKHETNTFCNEETGLKQFKERYVKQGEEMITFFFRNQSRNWRGDRCR